MPAERRARRSSCCWRLPVAVRRRLAALESQLAAREADATFARQQAARARQLLDAGATSQQDYEQAVAQSKNADAQVAALQDQIRQQKAELAYYRVTASTAGIVGDVPVRVGDRVTQSTVLTTVDDNAGLEEYIQVPVQQAPQLRVGLPVEVFDDRGTMLATERLTFVASTVDEGTRRCWRRRRSARAAACSGRTSSCACA